MAAPPQEPPPKNPTPCHQLLETLPLDPLGEFCSKTPNFVEFKKSLAYTMVLNVLNHDLNVLNVLVFVLSVLPYLILIAPYYFFLCG